MPYCSAERLRRYAPIFFWKRDHVDGRASVEPLERLERHRPLSRPVHAEEDALHALVDAAASSETAGTGWARFKHIGKRRARVTEAIMPCFAGIILR